MRRLLLGCWVLAAAALTACGEDRDTCTPPDIAARSFDPGADILEQLRTIPELTSVEEGTSRYPTERLFVMHVEQPVNHCEPDGATFNQLVTLLFRDPAAPVSFATNGYAISGNPAKNEVTVLLGANQLQVEHRYFANSRPLTIDWEDLSIRQAANDHHRLVQLFSPLLTGEWISTGASKGGMTAIFHRYFYPDDVKATVAYVAPETFGLDDTRYVTFLNNVGEASCRAAIETFQRDILSRRAELEAALVTYGQQHDYTFSTFGPELSLEFAVVETSFAFWQYGGAELCPEIPPPGAPPETVLAFMDQVGVLGFLDDYALQYYAPYFYQSATELGSPAYPQAHLLDLNGGQPIPDRVENYPPLGVEKPFDAGRMQSVHDWVRDHGERILFIYGENDPWTAGAYVPNTAGDSHLYVVPDGNHGASIGQLPELERTEAVSRVSGWAGAAAPAPVRLPRQPTEQESPPFDPAQGKLWLRPRL